MKLKDLNVSESERKKIQQEILGSGFGGKRVKGLVARVKQNLKNCT